MSENLYVEAGYVEEGWVLDDIYIDYPNGIILIPQAEPILDLVQTTPTTVYNHDMDAFWRKLRAAEDSEDGRSFPRICDYNQPTLVSGVLLAAVFKITDYYTVTYEDNQYAVNQQGLNTNAADRVNVNQVSIRSGNSAGLQVIEGGSGLDAGQDAKLTQISNEVKFIERAIHVDTERLIPGIGTQAEPFHTLEATLDYMEASGYKILHVLSDITVDRNLKNFTVVGIGFPSIDMAGHDIDRSTFNRAVIVGNSTGNPLFQECRIANNAQVANILHHCAFQGRVEQLADTLYADCYSAVEGLGSPELKVTSGNAIVRGFKGSLLGSYITDGEHSIGLTEGRFLVDATDTGGHVHLRGDPFDIVGTTGGTEVFDETGSKKEREIHAIQGLDSSNPLTITPTLITAGDIVQEVGGNGETISTVSRQ